MVGHDGEVVYERAHMLGEAGPLPEHGEPGGQGEGEGEVEGEG